MIRIARLTLVDSKSMMGSLDGHKQIQPGILATVTSAALEMPSHWRGSGNANTPSPGSRSKSEPITSDS